jgi:hypothetical protein
VKGNRLKDMQFMDSLKKFNIRQVLLLFIYLCFLIIITYVHLNIGGKFGFSSVIPFKYRSTIMMYLIIAPVFIFSLYEYIFYYLGNKKIKFKEERLYVMAIIMFIWGDIFILSPENLLLSMILANIIGILMFILSSSNKTSIRFASFFMLANAVFLFLLSFLWGIYWPEIFFVSQTILLLISGIFFLFWSLLKES